MQLLILRGKDDPRIETWVQRKIDKYVSHDIQNELQFSNISGGHAPKSWHVHYSVTPVFSLSIMA